MTDRPSDITQHGPEAVQSRWMMCPYQHGYLDDCCGPSEYATEAEAIEAAREWIKGITYDEQTQHEVVVLKVVTVFRENAHD